MECLQKMGMKISTHLKAWVRFGPGLWEGRILKDYKQEVWMVPCSWVQACNFFLDLLNLAIHHDFNSGISNVNSGFLSLPSLFLLHSAAEVAPAFPSTTQLSNQPLFTALNISSTIILTLKFLILTGNPICQQGLALLLQGHTESLGNSRWDALKEAWFVKLAHH